MKILDKKKTIYKQFLIDMGWDKPTYGWTNEKARVKRLLQQQREELKTILKHNQDDMTGLYDYDGIAEEVIDLVKE